MHKKLTFFLLFLVIFINSTVYEDNDVLIFTDKNFDSELKKHEFIMVKFYAPWCGHCKTMAPEYAKAAKTLKKEGIRLAKVDGTDNKELVKRFEINGIPTLKFFINGDPIAYDGGKTETEIVDWIRKKTGPPYKILEKNEDLEALIESNEVVVAFFGTVKNPATKILAKVGKIFDDVAFAVIDNKDANIYFKAGANSIVLYKKFDEGRIALEADFTEEKLKAFLENHKDPLIMNFNEKAVNSIFNKAKPGLFLFSDQTSENAIKLKKIFEITALKFKGKIQAVVSGIEDPYHAKLAEFLGITQNDLPTVRIVDPRGEMRKYKLDGEISENSITNFLNRWENGKLSISIKSQDVPATQDGDVYIIVGNTFEEVVLDDSKDVLVEIYAPWCGHCKQIAPIYEEVGRKLKHNRALIIAKIDGTANDLPNLRLKGYPTFKLFPGGRKHAPIDYEGERTVNGFISWIEKYATYPVSREKNEL